MTYTPRRDRYERMIYNRCGQSGLKLPAISLGLWHNFGHDTPHATKQAICRTARQSAVECYGAGGFCGTFTKRAGSYPCSAKRRRICWYWRSGSVLERASTQP